MARCLPKIFIEMIIPSVTDDDRVHFYWKIIEDSEEVLPTAVGGIDPKDWNYYYCCAAQAYTTDYSYYCCVLLYNMIERKKVTEGLEDTTI